MNQDMRGRILLVEDDELIRESVILLLEFWGYEVKTSASGNDVFEILTDFKPHLILMDIHLGELNGRDICRKLKEDHCYSSIPVIVMSGEEGIYNSIVCEGANDIILKPFDERTLISRIERQFINSLHFKVEYNDL